MARRRLRARLVCLATALLPLLGAAEQTPFSPPSDCIDSATAAELNQLLRMGGAGTAVVLCPDAHISIDSHGPPITFTAAHQSISTRGFPEDHSRATLVIENLEGRFTGDLTTAIQADCNACRGVVVRNLHVDGGREQLGEVEGGDALIKVGGNEGAQEVTSVDAWAARGYAVLHASEGEKGTCRDVSITENVFHTSGAAPLDAFLQSELRRLRDGPPAYLGQERPGTWTDGISVACAHSTVAENTVRDVSGVGIALRGAPGTQVYQNTVVARDRDMLVGIALVANPQVKAKADEFGGVIVRENRIHAASAMIRIGISTGSGAWSTDEFAGEHQVPFGSEIVRNRLSSYTGYYGYALALSDAKGLQVQDNAVSASIWGTDTTACYDRPAYISPTPLLRDPRSVIGSLQPSFLDKHFGFLLCVGPATPSTSFAISRHQINDVQARNFHKAMTARGWKGGAGAAGGERAKRRPADIPAREMHPVRVVGHGRRRDAEEVEASGPARVSTERRGWYPSPEAKDFNLETDQEARGNAGKGMKRRRMRGQRAMGATAVRAKALRG